MGKASSKKSALNHDVGSGRFEPPGPMNDVAIRNFAKTTLAAAEHLIRVYQVFIDHGEFDEVRGASCISFAISVLADNIRGQLTLRPAAKDEQLVVAEIARRYPAIFKIDGTPITPIRRVS